MTRGEVYWVNFDPSVGGEIQKRRPAVVVSNNFANRHLSRVQVVPITSSTGRVFPSEALITLNSQERKAMADQIATVSVLRVGERLGILSPADMTAIEQVLRLQLGL